MKITLEQQNLPNGCIQAYAAPVVRAAVKLAKPTAGRTASERTVARFTVKVDGERYRFQQARTLEKFISCIKIGSICRVFRNSGLGATIDFEL